MAKLTCYTYSDEATLERDVAEGRLSARDAEQVSRFAEFLREAGPALPRAMRRDRGEQ